MTQPLTLETLGALVPSTPQQIADVLALLARHVAMDVAAMVGVL